MSSLPNIGKPFCQLCLIGTKRRTKKKVKCHSVARLDTCTFLCSALAERPFGHIWTSAVFGFGACFASVGIRRPQNFSAIKTTKRQRPRIGRPAHGYSQQRQFGTNQPREIFERVG